MKHLVLVVAIGCALGVGSTIPTGAEDETFELPREEVTLASAEGSEQVKTSCLLCHSVDYITTQPRLTRPQWAATVEKMRAKYGAPIATNQVSVLVDYLTHNYGKEVPAKK